MGPLTHSSLPLARYAPHFTDFWGSAVRNDPSPLSLRLHHPGPHKEML